jgi:hypothetical protein
MLGGLPPKWTAERVVGRVVEGRVRDLSKQDDARAYCDAFRRLVTSTTGQAVICADYRAIDVFPPTAADQLRQLMVDMKPLILRSAVLAAKDHAVNTLQVDRVLREAQHPNRRRFHEIGELVQWLSEVLTDAERARISTFLIESWR